MPTGVFGNPCTPLHTAALSNQGAIVRFLLERGARPELRDQTHHGTPAD